MKKKYIIIGIIVIVLGIVLDQVSKIIVRCNMHVGLHVIVIPKFFHITYYENTGAAWGIFSNMTIFLAIVSFVLLCVFAYMYRLVDFKQKRLYSYGLTLIISGLVGNLIDRIIFRSVTDFLDFYIFGYDFPIFNLADTFLVVGFIVYAIGVFVTEYKKKGSNNDEGTSNTEE